MELSFQPAVRARLLRVASLVTSFVLLVGGCSSSQVSAPLGGSSTSSSSGTSVGESTTSTKVAEGPSSSTSVAPTTTLGSTTTTTVGGVRFLRLDGAVQVVPAFVVFVDENGGALLERSTLGDAAALVVYRAPGGRVLDGVAVRPDGSEAIVGVRGGVCDSGLVSVDLATGTARELLANAGAPLLSGDGAWLAYVRAALPQCTQEQLVVRNVVSGAERELGVPQRRERGSWAWSPDSARLAYTDCSPQCSLDVLEVASGAIVAFGSSASRSYLDQSGKLASIVLSVAAPVGWFGDGGVFATGRCGCDFDGAGVTGSWIASEKPTLFVSLASVGERTVAFAGDNELVVSAAATTPQTLFRRHGGGALFDLGVRSNGLAAWPTARPWAGPLPASRDGRPVSILSVARGAVVELESAAGAVVRVLYAPANGRVESIAVDRRNARLLVGVNVAICATQLVSVPLEGGAAPTVIGTGLQPSPSPDGTRLAYVANLWARGATDPVSPQGIGCALSVVVVRDLRTGGERLVFPPGFVPGEPATGSWEAGAGSIRWAPDGRRFAYIIGYEGGSTFVVDVDTLASRLVVATPAIDAALRERLGGYPEFFVQSWVDGGLHFGSFCYGCDVPAVHVRAADGYTVDEILATPQPPLDVRDGHALVQDSPGGRPPGLARVDPIGTTVVLRTDTSTGTWR